MGLRVRRLPKGIQLIALGMLLWGFGYGLHSYMFPVYLRNIGCTPQEVGFVFSISMAVMAASSIPGGILADKYNRRKVVLLSWMIGVPSVILYYFARDWKMTALGIALYSGSMVGYPALNAYAGAISPEGEAGLAFGLISAGFSGGMIASPLLAAYLSNIWPLQNIFLLSFAFFAAACCVIAFLPPEPEHVSVASVSTYWSLIADRPFMQFILVYSLCAFSFYMVQQIIPQYLSDVRNTSISIVNLLGSLMSLGQTLITIAVSRMADSRGILVAVGINAMVFVASMLCLISIPGQAATVICLFLLGGFMAGHGVAFAGVREVLGKAADGKAFALFNLATWGMSIVGPYLGGVFYSFSANMPFHVASVLLVFGGLLLIRQGSTIRIVKEVLEKQG
ncbi:MAG TPA: MFS transporter [Bacillota bacterium]|nr:MFS transporter [Bacillota bacterium]HQD81028.1 MFS transporter [Bacillota bacterium]